MNSAPVMIATLRHVGGETMEAPPRVTFRADLADETAAMLARAGFEIVGEPQVLRGGKVG